MNKNVAIVVGILILIIIGFVAYSAMKKPSQPTNKVMVTSENKPAASNSQTTAQGTLKSLLTSGKSQKCTYSYTHQSTTVNGTVYVANGKMRGDFVSPSGQSKVTGHMIIDGGYFYVWTDLSNSGIKMAVNQEQPATAAVNNSQTPDINQSFTYTCQGWAEDDSLFTLPSSISFMTTALPVAPSSSGVGTPSGAGTSPSSYCAACDNIPAGPGRDACRTQLHCQ
jgi:uncharacterized protein YxeA